MTAELTGNVIWIEIGPECFHQTLKEFQSPKIGSKRLRLSEMLRDPKSGTKYEIWEFPNQRPYLKKRTCEDGRIRYFLAIDRDWFDPRTDEELSDEI